MFGKEVGHRRGGRRIGRIRHAVLAALLAMVATVLVTGPALADGWPSGQQDAVTHGHHH
jgi:hypothetical protein